MLIVNEEFTEMYKVKKLQFSIHFNTDGLQEGRGCLFHNFIFHVYHTAGYEVALKKHVLYFLNWYKHTRCIDYLSGAKIYNYSAFICHLVLTE